jgi:hypothetical protein
MTNRDLVRLGAVALCFGAAPAVAQDGWSDLREDDGGVTVYSTGDDGPSTLDDARTTGGSITVTGGRTRHVPPTHTVRSGDTLWDITEHYYGNPWEWPRIWSYNPEITNPHWIYPLDLVRLLPPGGVVPDSEGVRIVARDSRGSGSIYLREQGWLALEAAGEIIGSPSDHMMLATYDQVYIHFDELEGGRPPEGEFTVFRELPEDTEREREPGDEGTLVRVLGAVRIDEWDEERRTARATIIEALDPIERGFFVADIPRRFENVPATTADRDLETEVVAALRPHLLVGAEQIVFVPVGEEDGLEMGNRFFITRRGDAFRTSLEMDEHRMGSATALPEAMDEWPEEVIAEGRVVSLRPHSAGLFITRSTTPVDNGDHAEMREGY